MGVGLGVGNTGCLIRVRTFRREVFDGLGYPYKGNLHLELDSYKRKSQTCCFCFSGRLRTGFKAPKRGGWGLRNLAPPPQSLTTKSTTWPIPEIGHVENACARERAEEKSPSAVVLHVEVVLEDRDVFVG